MAAEGGGMGGRRGVVMEIREGGGRGDGKGRERGGRDRSHVDHT